MFCRGNGFNALLYGGINVFLKLRAAIQQAVIAVYVIRNVGADATTSFLGGLQGPFVLVELKENFFSFIYWAVFFVEESFGVFEVGDRQELT